MKNLFLLSMCFISIICKSQTTSYWSQTGNPIGINRWIGTKNNSSFRVRTNNAQRMIIDSLGNAGIGTSTPSNRLTISSETVKHSEFSYPLALTNPSSPNKMLVLGYDLGVDMAVINAINNGVSWNPIKISSQGGSTLFGGNVGINTDNPYSPLTINGQTEIRSGNRLMLRPPNNNWDFKLLVDESNNFKIFCGNNLEPELSINNNGLVIKKITKAERDIITSPTQGLMVFVTDNGGYMSWYNSGWQKVSSVVD